MTNQTTAGSFRRSNTYAMTMTALMTAVTCILAPLSIPIGPVPISLTNFAIYLSLYCSALPDFLSFPVLPAALPSSPDQPAVTL